MLGDLLATRYRVITVLGSGGFGHTYIAEDTHRPGHPHCVLKHLTFASPNPIVLQQVRRLFQSEAETLERLGRHDQIPRLLAYFEHNQEFHLVQEFIEGQPLSSELVEGVRQSEQFVVALLEDVLSVLEFVHGQGVIHRDIKPDNLIRRHQDQKLILIDFGAVKAIGNTAIEVAGETSLSVPIYTSGYGASEQCMGRPRYSSDIYSLGIVAIQALTGLRPAQLPQDFHTCEVIWRDQAPHVSDRLAAILHKMVRYHCNQRYQSATEVRQDLQAYRAQSSPAQLDAVAIYPEIRPFVGGAHLQQQTQLHPQPDRAHQLKRFLPRRWALLGVGIGLTALAASSVPYLPSLLRLSSDTEIEVQTAISDRISQGEKMLSPWQTNPDKQDGVAHMAAGQPEAALAALTKARQRDPSDPETLIYLNNARIGQAKSYTIAVVAPLKDSFTTATDLLWGVAQAQDALNQAGGIQGVPIRVTIADDDNRPETAQQIAQALVKDPTVLGVVGHSISDTTLAAAQTYQAGQLVMVSPLSSAVQLSGLGNYIFRTMPSDRLTAKALANYMLTQLNRKKAVVFFNSNSTYSQSLKTEFRNALFYNGIELLDAVDLSRPDFDAFQSVSRAQSQGAEVLMLAPDHSTSDRAIQVASVNRKRLTLLSGDSLYTSRILTVAGEDDVGMVLAVPAEPVQSAYAQSFKQLWGESANLSWRTVLAYDAAQAILEGIRRNPNRDGVRRTLLQADFAAAGASGKVSFQASGDRQGNVRLMTVAPVKQDGQVTYRFQRLP
jgi:ABC-type branched-subunit amino acid transport system substrate-binding protein/predicted Ser/Thr protein kinase